MKKILKTGNEQQNLREKASEVMFTELEDKITGATLDTFHSRSRVDHLNELNDVLVPNFFQYTNLTKSCDWKTLE